MATAFTGPFAAARAKCPALPKLRNHARETIAANTAQIGNCLQWRGCLRNATVMDIRLHVHELIPCPLSMAGGSPA